jgi:glucokinase
VNRPAALGLDLGGTALKAAWIGHDGTITEFRKQPSNTGESAHAPLEAIEREVQELRASHPEFDPIGVGLGAPGVIDPMTGAQVGRTAHLPHWDSFPLGEELARRLGVSVRVDNDANLAALAEARIGAAQGTRTALMVTLGTGIGCGIVIDGRVVHGALGGAGELGHLPIGHGRVRCPCGVERCVEPEASASGLVRTARDRGLDVTEAGEVFALAEGGDYLAMNMVDHMTDRLAAVLATAIHVVNPEIVVIGGGGAQIGEPLIGRVRRSLDRYVLATHRQSLRLVPATLGERAGVVGAGLLAWQGVESSARSAR